MTLQDKWGLVYELGENMGKPKSKVTVVSKAKYDSLVDYVNYMGKVQDDLVLECGRYRHKYEIALAVASGLLGAVVLFALKLGGVI